MAEAQSAQDPRSALDKLFRLQDLDVMIREASDPDQAEELLRLGFKMEGLEQLRAAREELASQIDRRVLRLYQTAARRYGGRAVVHVRDKVCFGCWAMQPTGFGHHPVRIATCQSCGRILCPV